MAPAPAVVLLPMVALNTNRLPLPAPAPKPPTLIPSKPAPVAAPAPKAVTNAVASVSPVPKALPPPAPPKPPETTPAPKLEAKANPIPKPAPKPMVEIPKAPEVVPQLPPKSGLPTTAPPNVPKAEVKAISPPPKPVVVPELKPLPTPVAPAKEVLIQPPIPPALRQPRSVLDASNALAKIELLRPVPTNATSTPTVRPLAARVVEPKPVSPAKTNPPAPLAKVALPVPPPTKVATNTAAAPVTPPKLVPPPVPPKPASITPVERKAVLVPTNRPVRTNFPAATARVLPATVVGSNVAMTASNSVPPSTKQAVVRPESKVSPATNQPAKPIGSLAIASPKASTGGWVYLAAAIVLLALAGGIITYLLRPQPTPSAISQSLDNHRT